MAVSTTDPLSLFALVTLGLDNVLFFGVLVVIEVSVHEKMVLTQEIPDSQKSVGTLRRSCGFFKTFNNVP